MPSRVPPRPTRAALGWISAVALTALLPSSLSSSGNGAPTAPSTTRLGATINDARTVCVSNEGSCSIVGRVTGADAPVFVTAIRYEAAGDHWVASHFVNVEAVASQPFRIDGLTTGRWLLSARSFAGSMEGAESAWGRSEPLLLTEDAPAAEAELEVEPYSVQVEVKGVPHELMERVSLSLEWVQSDRVQVEGDLFLDAPSGRALGAAAAQGERVSSESWDAFQVFDSLQSVGAPWLAIESGVEPRTGAVAPAFTAEVDPFGLQRRLESSISPCPLGRAGVALTGPGMVSIRLHGVPGLWESQLVTVEVKRGRAAVEVQIPVEVAGVDHAGEGCRTAMGPAVPR